MSGDPLAHDFMASALVALIDDTRASRARLFTNREARDRDDEALHDFRVALRRLRTLLRVARALWGRKRLARFEGELRHYAQATGSLRDEEVLRETLAALELPDAARAELGGWLVRRARVVRASHGAVERLLMDGPSQRVPTFPGGKRVRPLDRSLDKLASLLESADVVSMPARELAERALERATRDVSLCAAADVRDAEAMHELRIREKRLRYSAELFAAPLGARAARLVKHATRMQKRLGELHDLDEALARLERARGLGRATQDAVTSALRARRAACSAKLVPHLDKARRLGTHERDDDDAGDASPVAPAS